MILQHSISVSTDAKYTLYLVGQHSTPLNILSFPPHLISWWITVTAHSPITQRAASPSQAGSQCLA